MLVSAAGTHAFGAARTPSNSSGCSLTQLTHITQGGSGNPSINAAGTRVAFNSAADLTGDNPEGNSEIFLVDTRTNSLTQLTHATAGTSLSPSINAAGTRVAFYSNADLTGDNPDGNAEIFLVDTRTNSFTQLTHATQGGSELPSINAAGTRVAFNSRADLTGDNPDGNNEIFLVDTPTGSLTQITNTTGDFFSGSRGPLINAAGTRIAFASSEDLTGDNPDRNGEIFLATCVGTVHDLGTMTSEETGEQEQ